jgi:hypothetical protein
MGKRDDQRATAFYAVSPWNPFPETEITAAEQQSAKTPVSVSDTACV